jgi:hypothetical protein
MRPSPAADGRPSDRTRALQPSRPAMGMYARFGASLAISLVVMYMLAFSQIETLDHFQFSLSVFWISLSMVSAMGIVMLAAMGNMLENRRLNVALFALFAVVLLGAFSAGRAEALVGDDAFLRSMIPHHSRAIHMCNEAALADPEVVALCGQIIESQRDEIAQMEQIMARRG